MNAAVYRTLTESAFVFTLCLARQHFSITLVLKATEVVSQPNDLTLPRQHLNTLQARSQSAGDNVTQKCCMSLWCTKTRQFVTQLLVKINIISEISNFLIP